MQNAQSTMGSFQCLQFTFIGMQPLCTKWSVKHWGIYLQRVFVFGQKTRRRKAENFGRTLDDGDRKEKWCSTFQIITTLRNTWTQYSRKKKSSTSLKEQNVKLHIAWSIYRGSRKKEHFPAYSRFGKSLRENGKQILASVFA